MSDLLYNVGQVCLTLLGVAMSLGLLIVIGGASMAIVGEIVKYWRDFRGRINEREYDIIERHIRQLEIDIHGLQYNIVEIRKTTDKLEANKRGDIWNK